jgi:hypothetical protein
MGSEGSLPPSDGTPLVNAYGGPGAGLGHLGTIGLGLWLFFQVVGGLSSESQSRLMGSEGWEPPSDGIPLANSCPILLQESRRRRL